MAGLDAVDAVSPELEVEGDDSDGEEVFKGGVEGEKIGAHGDERVVRRLADPRKPSVQEVEDHYRTHVPCRSWCPHCVRGSGKDLDHRKAVGEERKVSEYCFDDCFPGDELGFKLTILSWRERLIG